MSATFQDGRTGKGDAVSFACEIRDCPRAALYRTEATSAILGKSVVARGLAFVRVCEDHAPRGADRNEWNTIAIGEPRREVMP